MSLLASIVAGIIHILITWWRETTPHKGRSLQNHNLSSTSENKIACSVKDCGKRLLTVIVGTDVLGKIAGTTTFETMFVYGVAPVSGIH